MRHLRVYYTTYLTFCIVIPSIHCTDVKKCLALRLRESLVSHMVHIPAPFVANFAKSNNRNCQNFHSVSSREEGAPRFDHDDGRRVDQVQGVQEAAEEGRERRKRQVAVWSHRSSLGLATQPLSTTRDPRKGLPGLCEFHNSAATRDSRNQRHSFFRISKLFFLCGSLLVN